MSVWALRGGRSGADRWRVGALPVRTFNRIGEFLEGGGLNLVPLDAEPLMRKASRQTGLDDFGDSSFLPFLRALIESYESEANLSLVGRVAARCDTLRLLINRLRIEDDCRRHPEILEQSITQPIFVTGMPRTGTTHLHNLLALDPDTRVPMAWEVFNPWPAPVAATYDSDARIEAAQRKLKWLYRMAPEFRGIHTVDARLPQECLAILSHQFASPQFPATYDIPSYQALIDGDDLLGAYRYHRRFLQYLQWRNPRARWVLKAPSHLEKLDTLFRVYPDATVVQMHRDPLLSVASLASLKVVLLGAFSSGTDPVEAGRHVARRWAAILQRAVEIRERNPDREHQFVDIAHNSLVRDPIGTVKRLYEKLGLDFGNGYSDRLDAYLSADRSAQRPSHRYSLEQFGLSEQEERKRFAFYSERYCVVQ